MLYDLIRAYLGLMERWHLQYISICCMGEKIWWYFIHISCYSLKLVRQILSEIICEMDCALLLGKQLQIPPSLSIWAVPIKFNKNYFHVNSFWANDSISRHNSGSVLPPVQHQVFTCVHVDPDLCHHMMPLGLSELTHCGLVTSNGDRDLGQHWLR